MNKSYKKTKKHYSPYKKTNSRFSDTKSKKKKSKYKKKRRSDITNITNNLYVHNSPKTHRALSNAYVDKNGDYKEKPFFANFFKVGFLNDIPVGEDYDREMDGMKYVDHLYTPEQMQFAEEDKKRNLYGLERAQLSIMRLWNGAPREWLKLFTRILIIMLCISVVAVGTELFGHDISWWPPNWW